MRSPTIHRIYNNVWTKNQPGWRCAIFGARFSRNHQRFRLKFTLSVIGVGFRCRPWPPAPPGDRL